MKELEELSLKDGFLVNSEGKEVKATPFGHPRTIGGLLNNEDDLFKRKFHESLRYGDEAANAFVKGEPLVIRMGLNTFTEFIYPVQLYIKE